MTSAEISTRRPVERERPSYRPFAVEVASVTDLSPSFRRLTLTGPDLEECGAALLDQRIKLLLSDPAPELLGADWFEAWRARSNLTRPPMRTYTLAGVDRRRRTIDVDLACRPVHGPASAFALNAGPGDRLIVVGPDKASANSSIDGIAWRPGSATARVLLVGDETALPAIRNILATVPFAATGRAVLELPHLSDAVDLHPPPGVELIVSVRRSDDLGAAALPHLLEFLSAAADHGEVHAPDGLWEEAQLDSASAHYGWFAGESGWVAGLRRRVRTTRMPREACSFMGYWRRGRAADD